MTESESVRCDAVVHTASPRHSRHSPRSYSSFILPPSSLDSMASELTGVRKSAILLLTLEQDQAAEILKRLPPEAVEEVSREIASLGEISARHAQGCLRRVLQRRAGQLVPQRRRARVRQVAAYRNR